MFSNSELVSIRHWVLWVEFSGDQLLPLDCFLWLILMLSDLEYREVLWDSTQNRKVKLRTLQRFLKLINHISAKQAITWNLSGTNRQKRCVLMCLHTASYEVNLCRHMLAMRHLWTLFFDSWERWVAVSWGPLMDASNSHTSYDMVQFCGEPKWWIASFRSIYCCREEELEEYRSIELHIRKASEREKITVTRHDVQMHFLW